LIISYQVLITGHEVTLPTSPLSAKENHSIRGTEIQTHISKAITSSAPIWMAFFSR